MTPAARDQQLKPHSSTSVQTISSATSSQCPHADTAAPRSNGWQAKDATLSQYSLQSGNMSCPRQATLRYSVSILEGVFSIHTAAETAGTVLSPHTNGPEAVCTAAATPHKPSTLIPARPPHSWERAHALRILTTQLQHADCSSAKPLSQVAQTQPMQLGANH